MAAPVTTRETVGRAGLLRRAPRGVAANEALTATVASTLLVLLAVEGATLLDMQRYLSVHAFVGILLIPPVGLKLASTGWRMLSYYRASEEYVRRGPPHVIVRMLIAPVVVVSTVFLLGTGVALLALDQTRGPAVGLHQASFVVWVAAMSVHVLTRLRSLPVAWARLPGRGVRVALVGGAVLAGLSLAVVVLPAVDRLQDRMTAHARSDDH
jgi:arginine exporter protein ArgO